MKRIIRLTESDLTRIVKQVIQEQSEHVKNLYKSWANKKSGNPEKALSIIDDVFKYQNKLSKKDFAQYSSYEELVKDLDKIKQAVKSEDVTKIYEDKDLLVIAANTHEASCKYGAGSKWCTTARDDSSYWRRHNETGTEFFWIFKNKPQNDPNHKFSYHVKINGDTDWCNAVNNCMSTTRLPQDSYPKQHPRYNEIIQKLQEIHNSRDLVVNVNTQRDIEDQIEDWIEDNYLEIESIIVNDKIVNDVKNLAIDFFLSDTVYDFLPYEMDPDDDDEVDDFLNKLEKEINSNFKPQVFESMGTISGLSWLIRNGIENPIEYLNTHTIEQVINVLNENNPNGIYEVLDEVLFAEFTQQLETFTAEFSETINPYPSPLARFGNQLPPIFSQR
jgi:hypothetical protein